MSRRSWWMLCLLLLPGCSQPRAAVHTDTAKWEPDIRAFEASDRTNPPPKNAILFVGSSSIRFWKTLARDFPGERVINRGFGGSCIADSVEFADRIVIPYAPRTIVFYAGDNDLAEGRTPEQVAADYRDFVQKVHERLPETRIAFLAIKPSPLRWELRGKIESANRQIAAMKGDGLVFIDSYQAMLGADGLPRSEMYVDDRLHLNEKGYALWAQLVKTQLKL